MLEVLPGRKAPGPQHENEDKENTMVALTNDATASKNSATRKIQPTRNDKKPTSAPPAPPAILAFLTINDVAAVLRCSVRSVYRLMDTGRILPPTRFGGLLRWNVAAFEAWIAEGSPPCRGRSARRL
jgi:excisionase family DNA binding protein